MTTAAHLLGAAVGGFLSFLAWLGIQPSLQDLVKAVILIAFVLAILMIVGDVYRGEIQNKLHRIILAPSQRGASLQGELRKAFEARRRLRREGDITCRVPQTIVPLTLNDVHSNVLFYFRYRDCAGKLKSKLVESYHSKFHVRKNSHPHALASGHEHDHQYSADEEDRLSGEESEATIITMAASRVDYIEIGKIEPLMEKEKARYERLKKNALRQVFAGVKNGQLHEPEALGLAVKFHFPINPYFLLYRHPDTNVRTTAWLTVLTSVFALFMQLIYASGTNTASARPPERPAIVERTVPPQ